MPFSAKRDYFQNQDSSTKHLKLLKLIPSVVSVVSWELPSLSLVSLSRRARRLCPACPSERCPSTVIKRQKTWDNMGGINLWEKAVR